MLACHLAGPWLVVGAEGLEEAGTGPSPGKGVIEVREGEGRRESFFFYLFIIYLRIYLGSGCKHCAQSCVFIFSFFPKDRAAVSLIFPNVFPYQVRPQSFSPYRSFLDLLSGHVVVLVVVVPS